jgi:hypothetical protein
MDVRVMCVERHRTAGCEQAAVLVPDELALFVELDAGDEQVAVRWDLVRRGDAQRPAEDADGSDQDHQSVSTCHVRSPSLCPCRARHADDASDPARPDGRDQDGCLTGAPSLAS